MPRVLHVLSQRPLLTGSGVMLDAFVRHAARRGWEQRVVCGVPASDPRPTVGGLDADQVLPLCFPDEAGAEGLGGQEIGAAHRPLDFPLPGMSDVMPYRSSRFRDLGPGQLAAYGAAWRRHLWQVLESFRPDVVQSHHAWIVSGLLAELREELRSDLDGSERSSSGRVPPLVVQGHGTDLRQMALCPHLAGEVRGSLARVDAVTCLHDEHAGRYAAELGLDLARCPVVGAGYDESLFHSAGRAADTGPTLAYAGKLAEAKGVDCLLEAFAACLEEIPDATLHVAGSGDGEETERILARMQSLGPRVVYHGRLDHAALAELLRRCTTFVLPSLYEGLPLVLVEALASGCRLISTALPSLGGIEAAAGDGLELVPMPELCGVDRIEPAARPRFIADLARALRKSLRRPAVALDPAALDAAALARRAAPFRWQSVFARVEAVWDELRS